MRFRLTLTLAAALLVGCSQKTATTDKTDDVKTEDQENGAQENVQLQLLNFDESRKLIAGHKGKVVVMDVWSTTCGPCMKAFPNLVKLHERYGPEKVACVSLSVDYIGGGDDKPENYRDDVLKFLRGQEATFDNILSSDDSDTIFAKLDIAGLPVVIVYDSQGIERQRFEELDEDGNELPPIYERVGELVAELLGVTP